MILAEKITEERKKNGWSQEEMAGGIQMGECTVHAGFAESAPSC